MTRDGMPRAYIRVDPNLDQHPDPLGMLLLLCAGARQAERGRFKDQAVLVRTVGRSRAAAMVRRFDVETLGDGRVYIVGWDEWQEGDHTVAERMKRMRARRAKTKKPVSPVTAPPSPARNDVTTDAVSTDSLSDSLSGDDDGDEISPPPAKLGRRQEGTNPRALGTSPRQTGQSPRQVKAAEKRGGFEALSAIVAGVARRPESA